MKVYVLKVMFTPIDGWGRDGDRTEKVLGIYMNREDAEVGRRQRMNASLDIRYCDSSPPWIEEEIVR